MHTLKCKNIEELVEVVVETYELLHGDDRYVSFVAKYDRAKEILKELVFYGYDINFIEIAGAEIDGYVDEFDITILNDVVSCEKIKRGDRYYIAEPKFVFFDEKANSKCISSFLSDMKYEFQITDDESSDDADQMIDCHDCDDYDCDLRCQDEIPTVNFDKDGKGFKYEKSDATGYQSISYRSSEPVSKDDLSDILRKFYF